jgi:geranylgeranyl diphosphate synthase type II
MVIGALLAGASEDDIIKVSKAAEAIGLAFQIRDDILDVTGDADVLGKPVLSDEKNDKTTYVTFEGLDKSEADVKALSKQAIDILEGFSGESKFLVALTNMLIDREK